VRSDRPTGHPVDHAVCRGAVLPDDPLLRYRNGRAITSRRHDHLWRRLGTELPWVATQGVSTHWLRHTTLTWVERHFGYGIAYAYAGHTDTTYIKALQQDVATALAALTGQPHPWSTTNTLDHPRRFNRPHTTVPATHQHDDDVTANRSPTAVTTTSGNTWARTCCGGSPTDSGISDRESLAWGCAAMW